MKPSAARLVIGLLLALFAAAAVTPTMQPAPPGMSAPPGANDDSLFEAVIGRIRGGDGYYRAMGDEMRRRQYPLASVFNWRTPLLYVALAKAPWVRPAVPLILGCVVLGLSALHFGRASPVVVLAGVIAQVGAVKAAVSPVGQLQTEAWSGMLIALSILLYARRTPTTGALFGLAALFVRELAAPYCVVCTLLAARAQRTREVGVWIAGAVLYGVFFAMHTAHVWAERRPGDLAAPLSWFNMGGLPYLLEMLEQNNSVLLATPHIVTALVVALLVASLWASSVPMQLRATVAVYLIAFAIVGQSYNDYWGFVTAPSYAMALAYGIDGIQKLADASRGGSR